MPPCNGDSMGPTFPPPGSILGLVPTSRARTHWPARSFQRVFLSHAQTLTHTLTHSHTHTHTHTHNIDTYTTLMHMIFDGLVPGSSEGGSTAKEQGARGNAAGAQRLQGKEAEHGTVDTVETAKFTVKFVRGGWV